MSFIEKNLRGEKVQVSFLTTVLYFFSGNIFICHKVQSDSPVVLEEVENEADWFLSADVMYKIGESVL